MAPRIYQDALSKYWMGQGIARMKASVFVRKPRLKQIRIRHVLSRRAIVSVGRE